MLPRCVPDGWCGGRSRRARRAATSRPELADRGDDLGGLGKSRTLLGDDLPVIHPDAELPGIAGDELGRRTEVALELGCHPGSVRTVASSRAVANRHDHAADRTTQTRAAERPARMVDPERVARARPDPVA